MQIAKWREMERASEKDKKRDEHAFIKLKKIVAKTNQNGKEKKSNLKWKLCAQKRWKLLKTQCRERRVQFVALVEASVRVCLVHVVVIWLFFRLWFARIYTGQIEYNFVFFLFSLLSSAAAVTALRNPIDKLHVCNICNQVSALNVLERKMYAKYKRFVCRFLLASFDFHFVLSTTNETTKKYIYFSLSKTS